MKKAVKKELCPHCGASMMVNWYSMNKALVQSLYKIAKKPGLAAKAVGFTRVEYSVYTKLKWWGLIAPLGQEDGRWKVTDLGKDFILGKAKVPRTVGYFRNKLVDSTAEDQVSIYEVFPTEESKQKYRLMMTSWWNGAAFE